MTEIIYPYPIEDYEDHFNRVYLDKRHRFPMMRPAYQFGHDLYRREAAVTRPDEVRTMVWRARQAKEEWDAEYGDQDSIWDDIQAAVEYGWERAKALFSDSDSE